MERTWDVVVVGGGAAGLSAALVLGRARVSTLVIDAGRQSNLPAHGIGGLLGHDGRPPSELYADGRAELARYPSVEVRSGEVLRARRTSDGFALTLADGTTAASTRVLLAGGMEYRLPEVEGVSERWGHSAFHCPFCHGWEVRDRDLGVLDSGVTAVHRSLLLRQWSDRVTLFTNGGPLPDAGRLAAAGVTIDERPVARLVGDAPDLSHVVLADGSEVPCGGILVGVRLHQRSALAEQLGVAVAAPNPLAADAIAVDGMGATSVPGVYAAGDLTAAMPSVATAIAAGSAAAAMIVRDIVEWSWPSG